MNEVEKIDVDVHYYSELKKKEKELANIDILQWIQLDCGYCETTNNLRDYHWQYQFGIKHSDGTKEEGELQAICPKCHETNVIKNITLEKKE